MNQEYLKGQREGNKSMLTQYNAIVDQATEAKKAVLQKEHDVIEKEHDVIEKAKQEKIKVLLQTHKSEAEAHRNAHQTAMARSAAFSERCTAGNAVLARRRAVLACPLISAKATICMVTWACWTSVPSAAP